MLELILSIFLTTAQAEVPTQYDMETSLQAIKSIEYENTIEDVDIDLITYLDFDQFDVQQLTLLTFTESNLEPSAGQQLVTHVVLNRLENGCWGDTVEQVIFAPSQFCGTKLSSWGEYNGRNLKNVLYTLWERKFGLTTNTTHSLLYFNNQTIDSNAYAKKYNLNIITTIGSHTFYSKRGE